MRKRTLQIFTLLALTCATAFGGGTGGFGLHRLARRQSPREQYFHDGIRYVEALRGASYSLRANEPHAVPSRRGAFRQASTPSTRSTPIRAVRRSGCSARTRRQ